MTENEEMQLEYNLFVDVWKLYKTYHNPEDNYSYWNDLVSSAHEIKRKYKSKLCEELLLSVINELDRKYRRNKCSEQTKN